MGETEDYPPFVPQARNPTGAGARPAEPMRADARRNRDKLLDAAIEVILEAGGDPARDAIAARAGVGIGTLYRHFPDQPSLLNAVVRRTLERTIEAGEAALAEATDSFDALRRYMHAALDQGIGVVNLIHPLVDVRDPELRGRAGSVIETLISNGRRDGVLREDTTAADVVFATIRFGRPLAVGLSGTEERAIAHRHIDIYLDGLRSPRAVDASPSSLEGAPSARGKRRRK